jgi:membrane protein DedA with SNARE-associated domain
MEEAFVRICEHLSSNTWLQALLVIAGTCFIEDPARCGVGLLVAAGHLNWWLAFVSMTIGGMAGDIGLYVIGRYATHVLIRLRWVDEARLEWMEDYFKRHAFKSVLFARFIPGARTICYASAGAIRYPMPRFTLMLFVAAVVQSLLFLRIAEFIAEKILPYLRNPQLQMAVFAIIVLSLVLAHTVMARRRRNKLPKKMALPVDAPAPSPEP